MKKIGAILILLISMMPVLADIDSINISGNNFSNNSSANITNNSSENITNSSYDISDIIEDLTDRTGNYSDLIEDLKEGQKAPSNITEEYTEADQIIDHDAQIGENETGEPQPMTSEKSDQPSFQSSFLFIIVGVTTLILILSLRSVK